MIFIKSLKIIRQTEALKISSQKRRLQGQKVSKTSTLGNYMSFFVLKNTDKFEKKNVSFFSVFPENVITRIIYSTPFIYLFH